MRSELDQNTSLLITLSVLHAVYSVSHLLPVVGVAVFVFFFLSLLYEILAYNFSVSFTLIPLLVYF